MIPVFRAQIKTGIIIFDRPNEAYGYLQDLEGKYVEVVVRKERSERSNNQNKYYWGVVLQLLSDHTGYTTEEMHCICKQQFLLIHGQFDYVKSTTKLNTVEFEEYLDKIKNWSAVLGVNIPNPNECEA